MSYEIQSAIHADGLADVLERVLDKGVVIAGDVSVSLVGIELLTVKLRLLVASVDKARELGINWWETAPRLTASAAEREAENARLRGRLEALEARLGLAPDHSKGETP
ncbi:MAG: gas vesicle protein GvpJ [Sandaracinaceae bacterium]